MKQQKKLNLTGMAKLNREQMKNIVAGWNPPGCPVDCGTGCTEANSCKCPKDNNPTNTCVKA